MANVSESSQSRNLTPLEERDKVRKKPEVIFGTRDLTGKMNGIKEILENSVDEAREGFGDLITMSIDKDDIITVEDFGRGLPMHYNEDVKAYNWELALCKLYASGKYDDTQYSSAVGTNGLGLASMQFASKFMEVESIYDGIRYTISFKEGIVQGGLKEEPNKTGKEHGTKIRFQPDDNVFSGAVGEPLDVKYYVDYMRKKAISNDGVAFKLSHWKDIPDGIVIKFEDGPKEFINSIDGRIMDAVSFKGEATGRDKPDSEEYTVKMTIAFAFTEDVSLLENYHNGSQLTSTQKNMTMDMMRYAMVKQLSEAAKERKKLSEKDSFTYKDIEGNLLYIGTTDCPGYLTWFEHQTKSGIINPFIRSAYMNFCVDSVKSWVKNNKTIVDKAVELAYINKQAREEADKISREVVNKLKKSNGLGNRIDHFCDATTFNPEENEIYWVEGESAFGSAKKARVHSLQALLALTGKPLNCQKSSLIDAVQNEVILRIARALGCGFEISDDKLSDLIEKLPKFDLKKIRYKKIMICTDGDVDGKHIRCLCLAILYRLFPTLLKEGMVYIVDSPLFEIVDIKADTSVFAYSNAERDQIIAAYKSKGIKYEVLRSKGLGENNEDMMYYTTMSPETRRVTRVVYDEEHASQIAEVFEKLLGKDLASRKEIIAEFFPTVEAEI